MTAQPLPLTRDPGQDGYTVADLHALPDDGPRYELIDGSLIVSPSATNSHNDLARWIANILEASKPSDDYMVGIDQSTWVDDHNGPRPDVVVASSEHYEQTPFPISACLLVVEVVSPTSALRDTETKRALYARAGLPAYWIVVPSAEKAEIALAELILTGDQYQYVTHYTTGTFRTEQPWPVEVDLDSLAERRERMRRRSAT